MTLKAFQMEKKKKKNYEDYKLQREHRTELVELLLLLSDKLPGSFSIPSY